MKKISKIKLSMVCLIVLLLGSCFINPKNFIIQKKDVKNDINLLSTLPYEEKWSLTWGGSEAEEGYDIKVDSGIIYVGGYTDTYGAGNNDFLLLKYDLDGNPLWNYAWGGGANDECNALAIDNNSNVYCVGYSSSFSSSPDIALVKFYANDTLAWNTTWGANTKSDLGYDVAVGPNGSIYCVGWSLSFDIAGDLILLKFHPNGTLDWNVSWGGSNFDCGYGITLDSNSNIYCVGYTESFGSGSSDLALVKFDQNGNLEWNITWGGILEDQGNDIAIDTAGNIYCSGFTESYGEGKEDFVLLKVFPNKTKSWFHTWGGNNTDTSEGLVLDVNDSIYCVGWTQSYCKGAVDFAVLKYDSDGNLAWNISWGDWEVDEGAGIGIDSRGDIYCTGYSNLPDDDLVLVKFGPGSETTTIPGFNILYLIFGFIFGILIVFPLFRRKNRLSAVS